MIGDIQTLSGHGWHEQPALGETAWRGEAGLGGDQRCLPTSTLLWLWKYRLESIEMK